MESMPKRAWSPTLDPERLDVWNRMVKKLMALVIFPQPPDGAGITPANRQNNGHIGGEDGDGGPDPCQGIDRGTDPGILSLPRSTGLRGFHHHDGPGRRRGDRAYIDDFKDTNDSGDGDFQDFDNQAYCANSQQFAGSQRDLDIGLDGHQRSREGWGCEGPGDRLRLHPTMPLRTSSPTSFESHREELREVLPATRPGSVVQLLSMVHGTTVAGFDSLIQPGSTRIREKEQFPQQKLYGTSSRIPASTRTRQNRDPMEMSSG